MDEIAAYLKDKIERAVSFFEMRVSHITPAYLEQVERLAKRTKDPALAQYFRDTMKPDRIASALDNIRTQLKAGQIVEADKQFEYLQTNLVGVENLLRYPIFQTGSKQRKSLDNTRTRANAKRKRAADRKHRNWVAKAQKAWKHNPRLTVSACAKHLIEKYKLKAKTKTVADAIRKHRLKKVGGAG
jgi:hypothetical protein